MEHQLLLASLGLAIIVAVAAFLIPAVRVFDGDAANAKFGGKPAEIAACVLPFVGFLLTLPTHAPFARGQGLGRGFLVGGLAAILSLLAARRTRTPAAGGAALAVPVIAVAIPLLMMRTVLLDALMGVALGAFAVTFLLYLARRSERGFLADAYLPGLGATVSLAATVVLGTLRDGQSNDLLHGTRAIAALAFMATGALFVLIAESVRGAARASGGEGRGVGVAVSVAALGASAVVAALLGTKFVDEKQLIFVLLLGLATFPVVFWLHRAQEASSAQPRTVRVVAQFRNAVPFLGVLLIACAEMVSGQQMHGYGFALTLVAVYVAWAVLAGTVVQRDLLRLLLFGTTIALYRTFLARWGDDLHGVNLTDQYAMFGFIVGTAAPHLTAALAGGVRRGTAEGMRPILSATVAGLLTLALPGAVVLIFGPKCALALLLGAAIASVFAEGMMPILIAMAMGLALDQWNDRLMDYADISRGLKMKILAVVFAVVLAVVAATAGNAAVEDAGEGEPS